MADNKLRYNDDGSIDRRMPDGTFVRFMSAVDPGAMVDNDPAGAGSGAPGPGRAGVLDLSNAPALRGAARGAAPVVDATEPATPGATFLDASNAPDMPESSGTGRTFSPATKRESFLSRGERALKGDERPNLPGAVEGEAKPGDEPQGAGAEDFVDVAPGPAMAQRAAQPRFARVTNTQRQTTHAVDSPAARDALAQASEYGALATGLEQERMDREIDGLAIQADGAEKKRQIEEAHLARQQRMDAERKTAIGDMRRKREDAEQRFMNSEVDPDKYWTDRGTPAKILGGIGILMSGVGQSMQAAGGQTNTSNMALDMIDKAIARDIDAQKANIAKAGDAIGVLDGALANYQREFGDDVLAENAAYATSYKIAQQELDRSMAGVKSADLLAAKEQVSELLKQKEAEKLAALEQGIAGTVTEQAVTKMVPISGAATAKALASPDARLAREDGGIPGFLVTDKGAFAGIATDDVSYRKLRDAVTGTRSMQEAVANMARIAETSGAEPPGSRERAAYEASVGQLIGAINVMREAGVVNDNEYKRLRKEIPGLGLSGGDLARFITGGAWNPRLNQIEGIRDTLNGQADAKFQSWGGRIGGGAGGSTLPTSAAGEQASAGLREWQ